jgi:23S rRNA pseudouridine1911/1915/1917 synthase
MRNIINLIVVDNESGQRLDRFISNKEKKLSRTRIKNLILKKKLRINEKIIEDPSKKIISGDNILLEIPEPKKTSLKPYDYKLNIAHEDNDLLIINKPAGIAMHPGPGNYDNTLVNALMNYDKKNLSSIGDELRPGIVHRIDKDTSGLVVIAKNNISHENLSKQFNEHSINRTYQALIWGKLRPQKGKIETLITRSSKNRQLMEVGIMKGKKAITNYKTLEVFENNKTPTFSFVECKLETGRTHQIRVHMSYKGNNILGDKKYKKKFKKFKNIDSDLEKSILELGRQFLHAKVIGFKHPRTGEELEFTSKLPQDLEKILKKLRNTNK